MTQTRTGTTLTGYSKLLHGVSESSAEYPVRSYTQLLGMFASCKQLTQAPPMVCTPKLPFLHTQFVSEPQSDCSSWIGLQIALQLAAAFELSWSTLRIARLPTKAALAIAFCILRGEMDELGPDEGVG